MTGPNRVGVSFHLRTETDPFSETSCFSSNYLESGRWTKPENPVMLCAIHHRQNPIESTEYLRSTRITRALVEIVMDMLKLSFLCNFLVHFPFWRKDSGLIIPSVSLSVTTYHAYKQLTGLNEIPYIGDYLDVVISNFLQSVIAWLRCKLVRWERRII
jgi:hypothetical protein